MDTVLHNLRYQGDAVYLYVIAAAIAVPAAVRAGGDPTRRAVTVVAVVAPLLALPLWLQSVHALADNSPGRASREHFAALRASEPEGPFLDLPVPGWVVPPEMYPWNMAHLVLPEVRSDVEVTDDPDGAYWIRPDGSIGPVLLADLTAPTTEVVCVGPGDPAAEVLTGGSEQLAQLPPPVLLALDYEAEGPGQVVLEVGRQAARKDIREDGRPFEVHRGQGSLASVIAPARWRSVYVESTGDSEVCVTAVRLVRPQG